MTESGGLLLDFSKTNIDPAALDLLLDLALSCSVEEKRDAMFRGDKINCTENRAVLHTALRDDPSTRLIVEGEDISPDIATTPRAMETFSDGVRSGRIASAVGGIFRDVVNIDIGSSGLETMMAVCAGTLPRSLMPRSIPACR